MGDFDIIAAADQLVDVYTSAPGGSAADRFSTTSYPDYRDLKSENDVFVDLIGYSPMFGALNLGDRSRLTLGVGAAGPEIDATGEGMGLPPETRAALTLAAPAAALSTRTVGAYFAGLLAEAQGCRLVIADRPGGFRLGTAAL